HATLQQAGVSHLRANRSDDRVVSEVSQGLEQARARIRLREILRATGRATTTRVAQRTILRIVVLAAVTSVVPRTFRAVAWLRQGEDAGVLQVRVVVVDVLVAVDRVGVRIRRGLRRERL